MRGNLWLGVRATCCGALTGIALLHAVAAAAHGEDAFYELGLSDLTITDGTLPEAKKPEDAKNAESDDPQDRDVVRIEDWVPSWDRRIQLRPHAVLDGEGEIYLGSEVGFGRRWRDRNWDGDERATAKSANGRTIAVRAPAGKPVAGRLFLPNDDYSGMAVVRFRVAGKPGGEAARENFFRARAERYERLARSNPPGSAWFRHQALDSRRILAGKPKVDDVLLEEPPNRPERLTSYEDTFQVFSGGRAISENLQLDRLLRPTKPAEESVAIDTLPGITVAEMDWGPLTKDIHPQLDPLAVMIPGDQHAVFLPSFKALVALLDEAATDGTPVLQFLQQRAEDSGSRERYQRQLCLELDAFARLLGDEAVGSVVFTGSDPYLRTGTDVALLFETKSPAVVAEVVAGRQAAAVKAIEGCRAVQGTVGGVAYRGAVSPGRAICSYVATLGNAVVVTNSLAQLERLFETAADKETPLASLPEYRFFRQRYPRSNSEETAFLIVTDATIRRWCGPKWRVATSRRTRAAAVMMQLQASRFEEIVAGKAAPQPLQSALFVPDMGTVELTPAGIVSSTYGTLEFQTPIRELDLEMITKDEAESYQRWRDTYQQNWSQFFDPIAVSFSVSEHKIGADVTVMPLINASDYADLQRMIGIGKLRPDAGDRHAGALVHWAMALDLQFLWDHSNEGTLVNLLWGDEEDSAFKWIFNWLGDSVSVYADADPFWDELAKVDENYVPAFLGKEIHRLPVAIQFAVSKPLKLAGLLTVLRTYVDTAAPNMVAWEPRRHAERAYTRIGPTRELRRMLQDEQSEISEKVAIYYTMTSHGLLVTLNEDLLKRALDRDAAARAEDENKPAAGISKSDAADSAKPAVTDAANLPLGAALPANVRPWLGTGMALQIDRSTIDMLAKLVETDYQQLMQARAWSNIAILNEWKRRFPQQDPIALHAKHWQATLRCPGGGTYVWNNEYRTMESTVYGHPGRPKSGPTSPAPLRNMRFANFGVTFELEHSGLRARMELERTP